VQGMALSVSVDTLITPSIKDTGPLVYIHLLVTLTKDHRCGPLHNRNSFSYSSGEVSIIVAMVEGGFL
jgi:hypothetical protein